MTLRGIRERIRERGPTSMDKIHLSHFKHAHMDGDRKKEYTLWDEVPSLILAYKGTTWAEEIAGSLMTLYNLTLSGDSRVTFKKALTDMYKDHSTFSPGCTCNGEECSMSLLLEAMENEPRLSSLANVKGRWGMGGSCVDEV